MLALEQLKAWKAIKSSIRVADIIEMMRCLLLIKIMMQAFCSTSCGESETAHYLSTANATCRLNQRDQQNYNQPTIYDQTLI
jgi:hypothetical protein